MSIINFSGIASGIDSNALIDAISKASRQQRIQPSESKITELEDTNSSLDELKSKLRKLQTIIRDFATLNSSGVVKTGKSTNETVLTSTANSSASNGSYAITVSQLAKNATYGFKSTAGAYSSAESVIGAGISGSSAQRTVTTTVGTGSNQETVNVELSSSSTLNDFVTSYNASATKSVASVINAGSSSSPDYRVIIVSNNEGTEKGEIAVSVGSGVSGASAFNNNSTSQATNATFTVSGIGAPDTITRQSNTFSDVLTGVNITLQSTGSATLTVGDDATATATKVQEFVDTYNDIVEYISENDLVTRKDNSQGAENIFGPLAATALDENLLSTLRGNFSSAAYSSGTEIKLFADLGITTERDGTLKFDADVLTTAIGKEPASVRRILQNFGDTAGITGGSIDQYIRFNGLLDSTINTNIDLISSLNEKIGRAEASILKEEDTLRSQYARLESIIGKMNSQQNALSALLPR